MNDTYHMPVLLDPILSALTPTSGKKYIDATFGGGGHSQKLLEAGATVLGIDQDQDAIDHAQPLLKKYPELTLIKSNFSSLEQVAKKQEFDQVDGILFDLGVSSHQLDQGERGFSFSQAAPLDMRMDQSLGVTAADLIAALGEKELAKLFEKYGGEPRAKKIAQAIVRRRKIQPIVTTVVLAGLIDQVYRYKRGKLHPATKVFQALRIAVNDELNTVEQTLPQAVRLLKPSGRLAVISFHEGEDRIIKHYFKDQAEQGVLEIITHKVIIPDEEEIKNNPRARSAKLRIAQKV